MATLDEIAGWVAGMADDGTSRNAAHVIIGRAIGRSSGGLVEVDIDSESLGAETITLPTSVTVEAGDSVAITLIGRDAGKTPFVSDAFGSATSKEKTLYQSNGELGNITLSEPATNFDRIRIEYRDNSSIGGEVAFNPSSASKASLHTVSTNSGQIAIKFRRVAVNDTSITTEAAGVWYSSSADFTENNVIYITRVTGIFR